MRRLIPFRAAPLFSTCVATLAVAALGSTDSRGGIYSRVENDPTNAFDAPIAGFTGPAGEGVVAGNTVNPLFVGWADTIVDYSPAPQAGGDPLAALGPVTGDNTDIVSLGELSAADIAAGVAPGSITLGFSRAIANGVGADFAVFENGFGQTGMLENGFAELAYVEASSDGVNFALFPSIYDNDSPVGPFEFQDVTNIFNQAGKHRNGTDFVTVESWGTPFDLATLAAEQAVVDGLVDLSAIRFLRLVDIPGSGDFLDSRGESIFDPWVTTGSGGFDLEAVGVINAATAVPEPSSLLMAGMLGLIAVAAIRRRRRREVEADPA